MVIPESRLEQARLALKPASKRTLDPAFMPRIPPTCVMLKNGMYANIMQLDPSCPAVDEIYAIKKNLKRGKSVRFLASDGTVLNLDSFVGSGEYGCVFGCSFNSGSSFSSDRFIIKISTFTIDNVFRMNDFSHEYNMMTLLDCGPGNPIVCAEGVVILALPHGDTYTKHFGILMERMDGTVGNLVPGIDVKSRLIILQKMLAALDMMHNAGVYHLDAHTDNFLINMKPDARDADVRLADMGMSCFIRSGPDGATCSDIHAGKTSESLSFRDQYPDAVEFATFMMAVQDVFVPSEIAENVLYSEMGGDSAKLAAASELVDLIDDADVVMNHYMDGSLGDMTPSQIDLKAHFSALIAPVRASIQVLLNLMQ